MVIEQYVSMPKVNISEEAILEEPVLPTTNGSCNELIPTCFVPFHYGYYTRRPEGTE